MHDSKDCLAKAVRCVDRNLTNAYDKALAPTGLRTTQYTMLNVIMREGPISIGDLSLVLQLDQTTTTRNVVILEQAGLVSRVPHADPRIKQLKLTAEGKRKRDAAYELWCEIQDTMLAAITPEEWDTFKNVLTKLSAQSKELV
ncbi:MAG TPA: MarR family winged helix-turn-helix transcriptional regulator [Drouetiella sp.]